MIVKNEAHVLPRTLPMLCKYFDFKYWVISDTGSTDGTQELIRAFFKERGIPGELVETPWKNFGYNRSIAFEAAYNKTDYVLVWDADDGIEGTFKLPDKLEADAYEFEFGDPGGFRYSRMQLFNNRKRWKYVGVLHEYPAPMGPIGPIVHIAGDYFFVSGREGARNKDPDKYKKDAAVLEAGLLEEPDNTRHMFYCANSYMNANDYENAGRMYKQVLASNAWVEEKYISCLHLFETAAKSGSPENNLHYLVESTKYSPNRVEAITHLVRYYCAKDMYAVANAYFGLVKNMYKSGYNTAMISKFLFARKQDYDFYLPYLMVIAATKVEDYKTAAAAFAHICTQQYRADAWHTRNLFFNMQFIEDMPITLSLLFNMLEYRDKLPADGFEAIQNKNIADYIEKCIPLLEKKPAIAPALKPANTKNPRILLTLPCTSIDRFKRSLYSLMNTWTDLSAVDYIYCQKGRLSVKESKELREAFPFIEFGVDTPATMVRRMSPTYWIHLNDACTFVRRDAYVKRSIDCLTNNIDVHQLLYNRDYVYTYDAWANIPMKEIATGIVIHETPHMWALVPGCTRVKALEDIGMDITLESEYTIGTAWNSKAFKTAFLNSISYLCKSNVFDPSHIGFYNEAPHTNTFVINLEHRKDRRDAMEIKLKAAGITNYAFVKAVNGKRLAPTKEIKEIFSDNNFGNRRGVIGVALSHYRLWERLITDTKNTHYTIYEDDIAFEPDFLAKLHAIKIPNNDAVIFLGYHIWDSYNSTQPTTHGAYPLQNGEYLGGMHAYIITKAAAKTLCGHVQKHGMKLAVDAFCVGSKYGGYVGERCGPNIPCLKVCPPMVTANWVKPGESAVDSDIQYDMDSLQLHDAVLTNVKWKFIPGLDSFGNDIRYIGRKDIKELLIAASSEPGCIAVNTLGYLKHKVNTELIAPSCFGEGDGMFIREQ